MDIGILIDRLPEILLYFVPGYVLLFVYNFIRIKEQPFDGHCLAAVVVSYMLKAAYDLTFHPAAYGIREIIALLAISVVIGYLIARVFNSKRVTAAFLKIGIARSVNKSIWKDVLSNLCWITIFIDNKAYFGQYLYCEEGVDEPRIALQHYRIIDSETRETIDGRDYSKDDNRIALISTKDVRKIEISEQCKK